MGRNKGLNKLRKKNNNTERNGASGSSKSRAKAGSTTTASGQGDISRGGGNDAERGPLRKLLAFFGAYPFLIITLAIGLTRMFPVCMRWLRLRSGILGPVVQVHEGKQVLILGALGSGTAQMSTALTDLGVEVGHETSDSSNEFCRDGTISWVHGIRFLSGTPNLSLLCADPRRRAYTSTMFQPSSECHYIFRALDNQCWADECREVTAREYGCVLRERASAAERKKRSEMSDRGGGAGAGAGGGGGGGGGGGNVKSEETTTTTTKTTTTTTPPPPAERSRRRRDQWDIETIPAGEWKEEEEEEEGAIAREEQEEQEQEEEEEHRECGTHFRHNLLQVRHPLRTVTLLAYKSAGDKKAVGIDCSAGRQQLIAASSLFTNKFIRTQLGGGGGGGGSSAFSDFDWARVSHSCVQTWAWYWVVYNRAMLKGVDEWYRVEDTPPSKVAVMAGFSSAVLDEALQAGEQESSPEHGALVGSDEKDIRGFEVTWEDIAAFPGGLLREMSDLAVELGYEGAPGLPTEVEALTGGEGSGDGEAKKGWGGMFGFKRKKKPTKA